VQEAVRGDRVDADHRQLQRVAVGVDRDTVAFVEDRPLAPGGLLERRDDEHSLAYTRCVDPVANGDDATDSFGAERRGQFRARPIDALDQHQI
jgi:hypothetical protein